MNYSNYTNHYRKDAETYEYHKPPDSPEGQINRRRSELICHMIDKTLMNSKARILDVGSGGGALIREISRKGSRCIGLDIALLNLQKISEIFRKENIQDFDLVSGDAFFLPFKNHSLDAIIFSEVLEHLERPEKALAEAARVLKPGGQFIASVPYKEKIIYHLCIHCNQLTPSNAHLHSFDEVKLEFLMKGLPFHPEKRLYFHNKVLQMFNIPYRLRCFPYGLWRFMDRVMNIVISKPFYMVLAARKSMD
jgi:ubiquinone/menaquinone biosynthesis C-methylase UbiE